MVIPSELPKFVTAARSGALQALALQSGQVLDAKIIGAAPNGGTQVEIKGQMLNLVLPTLVKAGETIKLEVQGAGQQMRLALQVATAPSTPASPAPAAPGPQTSMPLPNPTIAATPQPLPGQIVPQPAQTGTPQPAAAQPAAPQAPAQPQPAATTTATAAAPPGTTPTIQASPAPSAGPVVTTQPVVTQAATSPASPVAAQPNPTPQPSGAPPAAVPVSTTTPATGALPTPLSVYPQAAPGQPNPLAAAVTVSPSAPAPAASAAPGAVRPVVPTTSIANATAHSASGNPTPQPQPQPATTPQAALAQMVQASVPRQGSVTALTTALTSIAGKVVLPEPVVRAAQQVLAGRVAIDAPRFDGAALQAALRGSGVFQEAGLVKGQALLQPDMKTALLTLRQTLTSWLGQQAPVAAAAPIPPPLRGSIPRARASEPPPPLDANAAPEEVGKQLLERTESALARVRLHQHASLPDPVSRTADWSMDLPVMVGTQQTLMQLQIHRDQHNETDSPAERGWQMRFALSLPDMGEVGAQVTLRSSAVGVMLWATEPGAADALEAEIALLREDLARTGLHTGAVIVRHGEPPAPPSAPPSGHFVDART